MRQPQLYDFVYLGKYGKCLFQVISLHHSPTDKYPTFEVLNISTLIDVEVLCPVQCQMEEIYGVPFSDIELHFPEGKSWREDDDPEWREENDPEYPIDNRYIVLDPYTFTMNGDKWIFLCKDYDPEPDEIQYLHELQQYHRGMAGEELDLFNGFNPLQD